MTTEKKRDQRIDILRFIAIAGIVVAHSGPPKVLFQLRDFDVTMMVLLMGVSYYLSRQNKPISYVAYVWKRFKKLILATWLFSTLFFIVFFGLALLAGDSFYFGLQDLVLTYLMIDGIGYVWIMLVFFLVAVLNPLILALSNKIPKNTHYFLMLGSSYLVYTGLILAGKWIPGPMGTLFEPYVLYPLGYGLVAAFGIRLKKLSAKELAVCSGFFLLVYFTLAFTHQFQLTSDFKYPPTLYYLSYGLGVTLLLYQLLQIQAVARFFTTKFTLFISANSLLFYFWHILPVWLLNLYGDSFLRLFGLSFITRLGFICALALTGTYLHVTVKTYAKAKKFQLPSQVPK